MRQDRDEGPELNDGEETLEASFTCQPWSTPNDMVIRFKNSYLLVEFWAFLKS